jgi:hypothetical protein
MYLAKVSNVIFFLSRPDKDFLLVERFFKIVVPHYRILFLSNQETLSEPHDFLFLCRVNAFSDGITINIRKDFQYPNPVGRRFSLPSTYILTTYILYLQ